MRKVSCTMPEASDRSQPQVGRVPGTAKGKWWGWERDQNQPCFEGLLPREVHSLESPPGSKGRKRIKNALPVCGVQVPVAPIKRSS